MMIGMGTPRSQSKIPRPIRPSFRKNCRHKQSIAENCSGGIPAFAFGYARPPGLTPLGVEAR